MPKRKNEKENLKIFRAKRNFQKTAEPYGKISRGHRRPPIFVIQKHEARRLHFDFRLEADGVLKSWAVPKGLPKTGERKLAVMVEDHPLDYQNFEGVIPKGNYGAGTVMVWDKGFYEPMNKKEGILEGIKKGIVDVVLVGEKVKGAFILVKFKKDEKNNWLIIGKKVQIKKGKETSVLSRKSMAELSRENPNENENQNKIIKSKIPDFIEPMKAVLAEAPFDREGWFFEIKYDGYRIIARKSGDKINLYSRNKKDYSRKFPEIIIALQKIRHDFILDGEIVALDPKGRPSFQLLQNYLAEGKGRVMYYVFDILYLDETDLRPVKLEERKKILKLLVPKMKNIKAGKYVQKEGKKLFASAKRKGIEGIMGKKRESLYQAGARSAEWVKIKTQRRQEAVIAGFTQPKGSRQGFGALILGIYEKGKLVFVGHVGTGFDENNISEILSKLKPLIISRSPFEKIPQTNALVTWVEPKLVAEIKFSEWTGDKIMRMPVFLGLREDKDPKEVIFEISAAIKKSVTYPLVEKNKKVIVSGQEIKLTNLEKIYWPDENYSKEDLIGYYSKISKIIMPYLKDRPLSLHRFPNGIYGSGFFQKDIRDAPDWIKTAKIFSGTEDKTIHYLLCQDEASLIYIANLGSIEINPWNSRVGHLERPDYLVFDIDPLNIEFSAAVKVAIETKKVLNELNIDCFCKTSGARGLHVFAPVGAKYDYYQVKEFAYLVNFLINKILPDITSLERNPDQRSQKVYLDYLQNREGQTMVAPYSLRPRPGAPVSTPLDWREVTSNLDPAQFNLQTIFKRIKLKGDLWKKILDKSADLNKSLKLLNKKIEKIKKR